MTKKIQYTTKWMSLLVLVCDTDKSRSKDEETTAHNKVEDVTFGSVGDTDKTRLSAEIATTKRHVI